MHYPYSLLQTINGARVAGKYAARKAIIILGSWALVSCVIVALASHANDKPAHRNSDAETAASVAADHAKHKHHHGKH